jgi:K+-sensing histidine kinase KdpD
MRAASATQVGRTSLERMHKMLSDLAPHTRAPGDPSTRRGPRIDDLKKLLEISQAINVTLDLDRILEMVMKYAIDLVSAERGFIMLMEQGELVMRQAHHIAPENLTEEGDRISQTIANRVIQSGESIYTSDAQEDERFVTRQSIHELHLRSIMGVPLKHDQATIGVIYLDNSSQARIFLQSDLYILELLAQQASIALRNARLLQDVRRLQQYTENIVASTPVALLVLDATSRVKHSNERGRRLLSALGSRGTGHDLWLELVEPAQQEAWATLFRGALESGHAHSWSRHIMRVEDEPHTYRVLVSPLQAGTVRAEGIVLTLDDITDAERMREELAKAAVSIQKADQIGDVAHEMNNYLTVVYNQVQIFERSLARGDLGKMETGIPRILQAAEKLNRLVEALLRPDRIDPRPQVFKLQTAIESLQTITSAERRFDLVHFEIGIPADLPDILFDPVHLEMILYNLCKNAAEAMAQARTENAEIAITAAVQDGEVLLTIEDSGPGLPPERQEAPWEAGHSSKAAGHGRGLHNTAAFVEKNGGTIEAVPKTARGGAGFKILIPIAER